MHDNYSDSLAGVWFAAGYLGLMLIILIVGITLTAKRLIRAAEKDNITVHLKAGALRACFTRVLAHSDAVFLPPPCAGAITARRL